MKEIYAIFGGNFDPIHYGHIFSAEKLAKEISIKKIILLPNQNPPHRSQTKTDIKHKLKMIEYAIKDNNLFEISLLETTKKKIFYTIDTLKTIRFKIGFLKPLCFIIGEDNLNNLNLWKNWKKILLYAHLLILPRITIKKYNDELEKWIISHTIKDKNCLYQKPFGFIFFSSIPIIQISSTEIRRNFMQGKSSSKLLPTEIEKYILSKKLY
ncbi:nicotinate-nucleotide adenylyltransferase [Buchnera aphidicola (Aphis helianthi)]|uniref:Probable nicotinate-nucleotide adenylyltransferase n=1 Tax=Buchnera aphidicola (Aphis helianthi) TaxID=2315802 RepID=A0A4D6XL42_9GAMM|nr:nicotinate-nucleotide adenylyltransferase [Buchnera aphidicola]QCI17253.1 nicotinate-nucleotide adenylyltransferase [Buchnera aphidicola (Aphis helianthi)]